MSYVERKQQAEALLRVRRSPAAFREVLMVPGARGVVRLGPSLEDFQRKDFEAFDATAVAIHNGEKPPYAGLLIERTKGGSKTSDAADSMLWLLWACPRMILIQIAASDEEQATEIKRAIQARLKIRENGWIDGVEVQASRILKRKTESTIEILTVDALGSHGARPNLLVIDELSHISDWDFVETLLDNSGKMPYGCVWALTNAGMRNTPAFELREMARQSPRWYFSKFDQPAPWLDDEAIAERRRVSSPSRFNRLWRVMWTTESTDGIDPQQVGASVVLSGPHYQRRQGFEYFIGVDSAVRRDLFAVCALGVDQVRGQIHLAELRAWKPTHGNEIDLAECQRYIERLHERFGSRKITVDPSHFWSNAQSLRKRGFPVDYEPITSSTLTKFAEALLSGFAGHKIRLYESPLVNDLLALEIEDCGARYRVSAERTKQGHADHAFAFSLALLPATDFLIHGEYEAPSGVERNYDPARHGVMFGEQNTGTLIQSPEYLKHGVRYQHRNWDPIHRRVIR